VLEAVSPAGARSINWTGSFGIRIGKSRTIRRRGEDIAESHSAGLVTHDVGSRRNLHTQLVKIGFQESHSLVVSSRASVVRGSYCHHISV
jgi:hypothetical protein